MSAGRQSVRLGEVLKRSTETAVIQPEVEYQEVTVRLWGKGVVLRGTISGAQLAGQRRFVARAGHFVLSRIDARHGASGLVPPSLDGALVSNDFPVFTIDTDRLHPAYLGWMSHTENFIAMCRAASEGTTNRVRLSETSFLALRLELPLLVEQQRVLRQLGAVAAELDARAIAVKQAKADLDALLRSMITSDPDLTPTPMRNLVRLRHLDVQVQPTGAYQFAGVYSFGRGVFQAQRKLGTDFAYARLTTLRAGNLTYPKLMAWEGAFGIVPPACEGCVVSPEFPVFEVDRNRVLPEVLDIHFRDPSVWPTLAGTSTGTNARRRRLNPKALLAYLFPLPSSQTQKKVGEICKEVAALRRVRAEADAEATQLLPSLLAETFWNGAASCAGHTSAVAASDR